MSAGVILRQLACASYCLSLFSYILGLSPFPPEDEIPRLLVPCCHFPLVLLRCHCPTFSLLKCYQFRSLVFGWADPETAPMGRGDQPPVVCSLLIFDFVVLALITLVLP